MFSDDPGRWFGQKHAGKAHLKWAARHLHLARIFGSHGLLVGFVILIEMALLLWREMIISNFIGVPEGWRDFPTVTVALLRGCMLFGVWFLLFEVYINTCSTRCARYTGSQVSRKVFKNHPRGLNRTYDCIRPGVLLAHVFSGAVVAFHFATVCATLFGGVSLLGPVAVVEAARMAELGAVLGVLYTIQFIRKDCFYLVPDSVQSRSRPKCLITHVKSAFFESASLTARFYGPALLLYTNSQFFLAFVYHVPLSQTVITYAVTVGMWMTAAATMIFIYIYVQDLKTSSNCGPLFWLPKSVIDFILNYPATLAMIAGPIVFFFLEDLGIDDIGPTDVAESFMLFVQSPVAWSSGLFSDGDADFENGHILSKYDSETLLASTEGSNVTVITLYTLLLKFLMTTVALLSWSMCHKLCEIFWTQPPEKGPDNADLVKTLATNNLGDHGLAPARYLAFAVLNSRLQSADQLCEQLYAKHPTAFGPARSSLTLWEQLVESCIEVLYEMYGAADALGAAKYGLSFKDLHYMGRDLERYGKVIGDDVTNSTTVVRQFYDRHYGEGYARPGWHRGTIQTTAELKHKSKRSRVVSISTAITYGAIYGAIFGLLYPLVFRPLTQVLYGKVNGNGLLTPVVQYIDPSGFNPFTADIFVGLTCGSVLGVMTGIIFYQWIARSMEPGYFGIMAFIDWWLIALRVRGWWFQPDLSEDDAIARLNGQVHGTFIVHRNDAVQCEGAAESYRITVTRDSRQPPVATTGAKKSNKKKKTEPATRSASYWTGTIELVEGHGYALREAPPKQPLHSSSKPYHEQKWPRYYAGTCEGLVTYYATEPYEDDARQATVAQRLIKLSDWSPIFRDRFSTWSTQKQNSMKDWLKKKENGCSKLLYDPLFNKSADDCRRQTFGNFHESIQAIRCLSEGLATANALPPNSQGIDSRTIVIQSLYKNGEKGQELEHDPNDREDRDIELLPRVIKALLRVQEGVMRQRSAQVDEDKHVPTHNGPVAVANRLTLPVYISTVPSEFHGALTELDLALCRILHDYNTECSRIEHEFIRSDPHASRRLQAYLRK